jgi:hypothetical protein
MHAPILLLQLSAAVAPAGDAAAAPQWGVSTTTTRRAAAAYGGRCVGRPHGYQQNERCEISVADGGRAGPCPVFQVRTPFRPSILYGRMQWKTHTHTHR